VQDVELGIAHGVTVEALTAVLDSASEQGRHVGAVLLVCQISIGLDVHQRQLERGWHLSDIAFGVLEEAMFHKAATRDHRKGKTA
jgi:hypothetical protein